MTIPISNQNPMQLGPDSCNNTMAAPLPIAGGEQRKSQKQHTICKAEVEGGYGAAVQLFKALGLEALSGTDQDCANTPDPFLTDIELQLSSARPYSPVDKRAVERLNHVMKTHMNLSPIKSLAKAESHSISIENGVMKSPRAAGTSRAFTSSGPLESKKRLAVNQSTRSTFKTRNI